MIENYVSISDDGHGIWAELPLLGIIEILTIMWLVSYLRHPSEPIGSPVWGLVVFGLVCASVANGMYLLCGVLSALMSSSDPRSLRIDHSGIRLPYKAPVIPWENVENYWTIEKTGRYGPYLYLYVKLAKRRVSLANPFAFRNVLVLGRSVYDAADIERSMRAMDVFIRRT